MSIGSAGVPGDPGKVLCESVLREGGCVDKYNGDAAFKWNFSVMRH